MGQAHLVPYKGKCTLIPGYEGLIELVRREGSTKRLEAHVVYMNDKFEYKTGLTTTLVHEPTLDGDPGDLRLAYAVAEFKDGQFHVEVMTRLQIEKIRNGTAAWQKGYDTPWRTEPDEMWRKTVIRRICKQLPKSAELSIAVAMDDSAVRGRQDIALEDAIEGTWAPAQDAEVVDAQPAAIAALSVVDSEAEAKAKAEAAKKAKAAESVKKAKEADKKADDFPNPAAHPVTLTPPTGDVIAKAAAEATARKAAGLVDEYGESKRPPVVLKPGETPMPGAKPCDDFIDKHSSRFD
jgi:recombination protein RecT